MGNLIPLALSVAPEIARWLFGAGAEKTSADVAQVIQTATGTGDPEAAAAVLQRDPAIAAQLRVDLARLAAALEEAARTADLGTLSAALRDTRGASSPPGRSRFTTWSTPLVSAVVLLTFGSVMALVMIRGLPQGSEPVANMLLGTLSTMATSVVSYWVGSSSGSARKDERLAQLASVDAT